MLLCVGGVALGDIDLRFVWQAWRLLTSTFDFSCQAWPLSTSTLVLRGRRGAYGTGLDLVALLVAVSRPGRRGTWRHRLSFCVAGMALDKRFAWHTSHLATSTLVLRGRRGTCGTWLDLVARLVAVSRPIRRGTLFWQALRLLTSMLLLRGRRGAW